MKSPEVIAQGDATSNPPPPPSCPLVTRVGIHFSNPKDSIQVLVDDYAIKIPNGFTVLQTCEVTNIGIPGFCYPDRHLIAWICRMCFVRVEKSPKHVASRSIPTLQVHS